MAPARDSRLGPNPTAVEAGDAGEAVEFAHPNVAAALAAAPPSFNPGDG